MKKKSYKKPAMRVAKLQRRTHVLVGSAYETSGSGKTGLNEMGEQEDL